jgi:hypothetical protein
VERTHLGLRDRRERQLQQRQGRELEDRRGGDQRFALCDGTGAAAIPAAAGALAVQYLRTAAVDGGRVRIISEIECR